MGGHLPAVGRGTDDVPKRMSSRRPHNGNGGAFGGTLLSIMDLVRNDHCCLVAEIHYPLDPIPGGATPGSHDNLSQRNLVVIESDNPGSTATHTVQSTFEIKPSVVPILVPQAFGTFVQAPDPAPNAGRRAVANPADLPAALPDAAVAHHHHQPAPGGAAHALVAAQPPAVAVVNRPRRQPDELMIRWNNLSARQPREPLRARHRCPAGRRGRGRAQRPARARRA